ncbi:MAG: NrdH-redoxin [Candidatus Magasanikbacteria bacterium CG_4_9_14_3_um_filter_32_9]|uniref:NrdH-redoxin n=1 Tax=Candidatus Magasanikbacteria bacterium CG_4_9_14_3_um_filter_32_9 TaxID=1974644 RepID=A0A2M7Z638_9BACT|nr:MAG: NrdH-redoxin [Candidatus Magasanikbacteria bacterium CG_4_9_14_3_um_filter_32_9]
MKVLVYSTPTCPYCHKAKDYLKEKGVEFEDINVAEDREKAEEMQEKSGQLGVPVLDIGGEILIGFDKTQIDEVLAKLKE